MKYNFMSIGVPVKAQQWNDEWIDGLFYHDYVEYSDSSHQNQNGKTYEYKLKDEFGGTFVDVGDWIVEFPNGEVVCINDNLFKSIFVIEKISSSTQRMMSFTIVSDCV